MTFNAHSPVERTELGGGGCGTAAHGGIGKVRCLVLPFITLRRLVPPAPTASS